MYQFIDSLDPREHDAFIKAHLLCDLLQSSAWAEGNPTGIIRSSACGNDPGWPPRSS